MATEKPTTEKTSLKNFVLPQITDDRKKPREFKFSGKVISTETYEANTSNGAVEGIVFELENLPYKLRLLKGSCKGASRAQHFIGCDVEFTGNIREYNGREYFNALDCRITRESSLAKLAKAGLSYSGSLD